MTYLAPLAYLSSMTVTGITLLYPNAIPLSLPDADLPLMFPVFDINLRYPMPAEPFNFTGGMIEDTFVFEHQCFVTPIGSNWNYLDTLALLDNYLGALVSEPLLGGYLMRRWEILDKRIGKLTWGNSQYWGFSATHRWKVIQYS